VSNDFTEPVVKITMNMMYAEQQQTNKMLAKAVTHLEHLADLPERVRALELVSAEQREVIKNVKATQAKANGALIGAVLAILGSFVNMIVGK
jgi:hypothetical protein